MIYLDNAATSYIKPICVEQAVLNALRTAASPGRGSYTLAMNAAEILFSCRNEAAELFNVDNAENIVFTSNASHGLNIAIKSIINPGDRVLISGFEHNSVSRPLFESGAKIIVAGRKLFDKEAILNDFYDKMRFADAVVCTHVSNVFGFILPIYEISRLCKERDIPLIIDASQSAGVLEIDAKRLSAAFIAMPGHKGLFGPQGTGILICSHEAKPLICGGSGSDSKQQSMPNYLPDRLEAGTHNVPGIAGLCAGLKFIKQKGLSEIFDYEVGLLNYMKNEMESSAYTLYSGMDQTGVISLSHKDLDCEQLAYRLSEDGVCVRAGLHCAPIAHESAGTLDKGTVRFSFSPFTNEAQIHYTCERLRAYCS